MNDAVTSQTALASESGGDYQQAIVPATAFGTFVPGMARRVVDQFGTNRLQNREPLLNDRFTAGGSSGLRTAHAGSTFLNGLTVTAW